MLGVVAQTWSWWSCGEKAKWCGWMVLVAREGTQKVPKWRRLNIPRCRLALHVPRTTQLHSIGERHYKETCKPWVNQNKIGKHTLLAKMSGPARTSFPFILGPLHWSSIFPTSREHRNIVQLWTTHWLESSSSVQLHSKYQLESNMKWNVTDKVQPWCSREALTGPWLASGETSFCKSTPPCWANIQWAAQWRH